MTTKKNRNYRNTKKKNSNQKDDIVTNLKQFIMSRKLKKAKAKTLSNNRLNLSGGVEFSFLKAKKKSLEPGTVVKTQKTIDDEAQAIEAILLKVKENEDLMIEKTREKQEIQTQITREESELQKMKSDSLKNKEAREKENIAKAELIKQEIDKAKESDVDSYRLREISNKQTSKNLERQEKATQEYNKEQAEITRLRKEIEEKNEQVLALSQVVGQTKITTQALRDDAERRKTKLKADKAIKDIDNAEKAAAEKALADKVAADKAAADQKRIAQLKLEAATNVLDESDSLNSKELAKRMRAAEKAQEKIGPERIRVEDAAKKLREGASKINKDTASFNDVNDELNAFIKKNVLKREIVRIGKKDYKFKVDEIGKITEVTPNGSIAEADLKVGDIILSFDAPNKEAPTNVKRYVFNSENKDLLKDKSKFSTKTKLPVTLIEYIRQINLEQQSNLDDIIKRRIIAFDLQKNTPDRVTLDPLAEIVKKNEKATAAERAEAEAKATAEAEAKATAEAEAKAAAEAAEAEAKATAEAEAKAAAEKAAAQAAEAAAEKAAAQAAEAAAEKAAAEKAAAEKAAAEKAAAEKSAAQAAEAAAE
jgi:hypothetical protein